MEPDKGQSELSLVLPEVTVTALAFLAEAKGLEGPEEAALYLIEQQLALTTFLEQHPGDITFVREDGACVIFASRDFLLPKRFDQKVAPVLFPFALDIE